MGTLRFRHISSDDPNALADLTTKVEALEALQERMKKANTVIRGNTTVAAKVAGLGALGITETEAYRLLRPDFAGDCASRNSRSVDRRPPASGTSTE